MENLIIKYPRKEGLNTSRPPLWKAKQCRKYKGNPIWRGRGWSEGYVWVCVCVQQQCLSLFKRKDIVMEIRV